MVKVMTGDEGRRFKVASLPKRPTNIPPAKIQDPPKNNYRGSVTIAMMLRPSKDYGVDDVVKLRNALLRNSTRYLRFVCLTDESPHAFPHWADLEIFPLRHLDWITKQSKLEMFRPELMKAWGRTLYLDLDTVICGSVEDILSYDGDFAMLPDFSDPLRLYKGSGLMSWGPGFENDIYDFFRSMPADVRNDLYRVGGGRSDQLFINHYTPIEPHLYDLLWHGQVLSYKKHCRFGTLPDNARIVCFHGRAEKYQLKNVTDAWVLENWR